MNENKSQFIDVKCKHHFWRVEKDNVLYAEDEDRAPILQYAKQIAAKEGISIRVFDNNDTVLLECPSNPLEEKLG